MQPALQAVTAAQVAVAQQTQLDKAAQVIRRQRLRLKGITAEPETAHSILVVVAAALAQRAGMGRLQMVALVAPDHRQVFLDPPSHTLAAAAAATTLEQLVRVAPVVGALAVLQAAELVDLAATDLPILVVAAVVLPMAVLLEAPAATVDLAL